MKRTIVAILAHQAAAPILARHWPYYEKSGCDLLGISRMDRPVAWPHPVPSRSFVGSMPIGNDGYAGGTNHLDRLLYLCKFFLRELSNDYQSICVIEYDGVFLGPLPAHPGGLATTVGGYGDGRDFAPCAFFHTPWWMDAETAGAIVEYGERMLRMNILERGFVDRWLGLMVELYRLPWTPAPSFSVNSLDPPFIEPARKAIREGAVYVHGVKTAEQLQKLIA